MPAKLRARLSQMKDGSGRPVLTDVQITREENYPQLDLVVDRQKAGVSGITVEQVAQTVLASMTEARSSRRSLPRSEHRQRVSDQRPPQRLRPQRDLGPLSFYLRGTTPSRLPHRRRDH